MGKRRVLVPAEELDLSTVKYEHEEYNAPHLTGYALGFFVKILETPLIGNLVVNYMKKQNKFVELLQNTTIPETPMFKPEYPPQEPEKGVVDVEEDGKPEDRVEIALKCLPPYDPASCWTNETNSFRYWKIRDYHYAYRSKIVTPSIVAEHFISAIEEIHSKKPPTPLLVSFDADELRKQAAACTRRFEKGNPLSILDGIFVAIKDDIDCFPHPSKAATTWLHEVRPVKEDAICVSRLRKCGAIFVGKANMHELGLGTTGNNPNHGTTRNPHAPNRYTGGSSSGPAAMAGSIRIPSSLCGVVGLKTSYGRVDMEGSTCDAGTVEIIGPLASSVEDLMLVYAAILGPSPANKIILSSSSPCLPDLSSSNNLIAFGPLRLGKYTEWFNDVYSTDISNKCEDALNLLVKDHGCEIVEIVIPELREMATAHVVSIGSESLAVISPDYADGYGPKMTYDTRANLALFQAFSAADYVAAQRLRRRIMHHHMEIFKKVDVIVTPTTGMTAPKIPSSALKSGESNLRVSGYLMRFILAGNLLGLPAISVPVGYDKEGLPIGLQLIGRPWGEASLLRLASAVEELCWKSKKKPVSFYDLLKTN
ncbi:Amidase signature domain [Dillenia turbinata]|uniref:Amidase signature domain n=1 Tax=Dillenia turbinata TaxID=194707 RepID=A0AAN8YX29_9MAGN